jgi:hypothetical protein
VALRRAADREPGWLDWFIAKLATYRVSPPVTDLATATAYLRVERHRTLIQQAARDLLATSLLHPHVD